MWIYIYMFFAKLSWHIFQFHWNTIDVPISFIQLSLFQCSVKLSQLAGGLLIRLDVKFNDIRVVFPAPLNQHKWREMINPAGGGQYTIYIFVFIFTITVKTSRYIHICVYEYICIFQYIYIHIYTYTDQIACLDCARYRGEETMAHPLLTNVSGHRRRLRPPATVSNHRFDGPIWPLSTFLHPLSG